MLFTTREKKELLRRAEKVVSTASIISMLLDEGIDKLAQKANVEYQPMHPWCMYTYVLAGIGAALVTAGAPVGTAPMDKLGVRSIRDAFERGRRELQRSPSTRNWGAHPDDFVTQMVVYSGAMVLGAFSRYWIVE